MCAINGSLNSFMQIIKHFNKLIEENENEDEQKKIKDEFIKILNLQNNLGNTVLHESVINER